MALVKCPRCELNYMQEGEKYCKVCIREMKGLDDTHEHVEMCIVCGERPARPGNELCSVCLSEHKSLAAENDDVYIEDIAESADEALHEVDELESLDGYEVMEENDTPESEMSDIESEFGDDDDFQ